MIERMKELIAQLRAADTAYYKHDNPILTDREYDKLYDELLSQERQTGITLSGSPTQKVSGEILEELQQVAHTRPMLSAKKTKSKDEIAAFIGGRPAVISWKLDGLTLVLRYDGGQLTQAITRGAEGRIGEDVTHSVRVMTNVPLTIPFAGTLEVRGEGVVSWDRFNKANENLLPGEEPYAHPRSLAAGSVRRLDTTKARELGIEFFAFELVSDNEEYPSKTRQFMKLWELGFDVVPYKIAVAGKDNDWVKEKLDSFNPSKYGYPVDGLVIEYDDIAFGKSLGATGHHENCRIALKWEDELHETEFLGLELATTRTGMISITGKFADVIIDGAKVNRAYLHNLDVLDNFSLGIGDRVQLYKANKIIPQMAENLTRSGTLEYPDACPCCGSELSIRQSDSGTRLLFCENPVCPAKLVRKFVHFCHKTRMNIEGLSETRIQALIDAGLLKNLGDLYNLRPRFVTMADIPRFGPTLVERLLNSIEKSRTCSLNRFIAGLGIPMVGRTAGRVLSEHFDGDWDAFEQAIKDGYDFTQLNDFGQTMHDNIYAWYADEAEALFWRPLLQYITFNKEEKIIMNTNQNNPFAGKTVVATGKLENYTRDGIDMELLSLGAKPAHSVSKKTDYVIVGEGAGSKLTKARDLGITTLTETEFEAMKAPAAQSRSIGGEMVKKMFQMMEGQ